SASRTTAWVAMALPLYPAAGAPHPAVFVTFPRPPLGQWHFHGVDADGPGDDGSGPDRGQGVPVLGRRADRRGGRPGRRGPGGGGKRTRTPRRSHRACRGPVAPRRR